MSISTLILGTSGTGKSTSLRNMNPADTLLIQSIRKPLPFRSRDWKPVARDEAGNAVGNIVVTDDTARILAAMKGTRRPIIVIDDFQYVLANEYMRRTNETGYQKFTDIGKNAWDILMLAANLADEKRVYILSHTDTTDDGRVKAKTIGKMLDEKITVEGLFTICLRTKVVDDKNYFTTRNSGQDTVKSPMGLFDDELIDNDLNAVDAAIVDFYGLEPAQPANHPAPNPAAAAA